MVQSWMIGINDTFQQRERYKSCTSKEIHVNSTPRINVYVARYIQLDKASQIQYQKPTDLQ